MSLGVGEGRVAKQGHVAADRFDDTQDRGAALCVRVGVAQILGADLVGMSTVLEAIATGASRCAAS